METVFFLYLTIISVGRAVIGAFLLTEDTSTIPVIVFVTVFAMVAYGAYLMYRKLRARLTLRDLRLFFSINTIVTIFNLIFVSSTLALTPSLIESLFIGSFLGVVIDLCIVYMCQRRINRQYIAVEVEKVQEPEENEPLSGLTPQEEIMNTIANSVHTNRYNLAVFDLDGTLLDSLDDIANACNYTLRELGYPERSTSEIEAFVGDGAKKLISRILPEEVAEDSEDFRNAFSLYRKRYGEHSMEETKPYAGILPLLETLQQKGVKTAILSNKPHDDTVFLSKHYFNGLVDITFGQRDSVPRKPDPAGLLEIIDLAKETKESTLYVGDTAVDIITGLDAEVSAVGVTWGFRTEEQLKTAGAEMIVHNTQELEHLIIG